MLSMRSTMYEVLDVPRMMKIKSATIRNRQRIPVRPNGRNSGKENWSGLIVLKAGTPVELLRFLPENTELRQCVHDKSVWEAYLPHDFKKSVKLLAKRLDAIAFM